MRDPDDALRAALADRYALGEQIGAGGMGTVFLAEDLKHNRTVAIKVLRSEFASAIGTERFLREIEIAAGLTHPNIVPLYDSGNAGGVPYYVMPYVEGRSLKEHLKADGAMDVSRALEITRDVADALAHAHARNFIHRDIKPGNILVAGRHGQLVDFGIARALEAAASPSLTTSGVIIGTPMYMSPEQFAGGDETDDRSDIYALGCVLYEALTATPPFKASSPAAVMAGHIQGRATPLADVRPDVPPAVGAIVDRMLAKDPEERFQTAEALVEALGGAITGVRSGARPRRPPARKRRKALALGATLATVAALVAFVFGPWIVPPRQALDDAALVVLPFHDAVTTPDERLLLVDVADELTRQLNRWDSLRAIPSVSLTGAMFDLGVDGPTLERPDDGYRVASEMGAGRLVMLSLRQRGDSIALTATINDVASGRPAGAPIESTGSASDPHELVAAVTHAMLGLDGSVSEVEELRRQSSVPGAVRSYREGVRHLEASRLGAAEAALRAALDQDSTFVMARHRLALTLHWRGIQDEAARPELAPEIESASLEAVRGSRGLAARDSLHVLAFYRFRAGDYEDARRLYEEVLDGDPADPYAWLLLGAVEFDDDWLEPAPDGALRPRSDLNRAMDAFTEALRLSPGFHLGYGQVFDITRMVLQTADVGQGWGYRLPGNELIGPWERTDASDLVAFYPVYADSITLLDSPSFELQADTVVQAGADRLVDRSIALVRRWAAFAPTEPRPLEESVTWTLIQREKLVGTTRRQEADSLSLVALADAEAALARKADTVPSDWVRLSGLRLSVNDVEGASEAVDRALEVRGTDEGVSISGAAANVRLLRGDVSGALALTSLQSYQSVYFGNPDDGLYGDLGAGPLLERILILGATGTAGALLRQEFAELDRLWGSEYSGERLRRLRSYFASRIDVAIALDEEQRDRWSTALEEEAALWSLFRPGTTAADIEAALTAREGDAGPDDLFVLALAARGADEHRLAVRLLEQLDGLVYDIDQRDTGWGLRPLSFYLRARLYEGLGNPQAAGRAYRRFLDHWTVDDPLTAERRRAAEDALARILGT